MIKQRDRMSCSVRTRPSILITGQTQDYSHGLISLTATLWPPGELLAALAIQTVLAYQSGELSDVEYSLH